MRDLLARGKVYRALNQCNAMLGREPHPEFYVLRAEAFNQLGQPGDAERDARAGLTAFPGNPEALWQLAIAEQGLGRRDSALVHFRKLMPMRPGSVVEIREHLAMIYQAKKEFAAALAQLDSARNNAPPPNGAQTSGARLRAECLAELGDTAAAREAFDAALALDPENPVIYNSRGWFLYASHGDHRRAIEDYDRAIRRNPNYSYAFNNRGWSYYKLGDTNKALRDINLARRKKAFNPFTYRNLGIIALEGGDKVTACAEFHRALDYNFTAIFGDEVQRLTEANCPDIGKSDAPPVPNAPGEPPAVPGQKPILPARTNAP